MNRVHHDVEERLEDTMDAYIGANLPVELREMTRKVGFDFDENDPPFVFSRVPRVEEEPKDTGRYVCELHLGVITTRTSIDRDTHRRYVGSILDLIYDTNLTVNLQTHALENGLSIELVTKLDRLRTVEGGLRYTVQRFEVECVPRGTI